ncbi:MAG: hypothetical protein JKY89_05340 [Immundisolibacteraceae bacterium]|nr:hypothetical protein [Immundisolibacteraceae bacterium]
MVVKSIYQKDAVDATHRALIEIMRALGEYRDEIVLIGGWIPSLLINQPKVKHIGSLDIDLAVDHTKLDDEKYKTILKILEERGFKQEGQPFQFVKVIEVNHKPYKVRIDLLAGEYHGTSKAHRHQNAPEVKLRKARGADIVFTNFIEINLEGLLPDKSIDQVSFKIASIAAFLAMKGMALADRFKEKDAYDIYYCVKEYPGGIKKLVEDIKPAIKRSKLIQEGFEKIRSKFQSIKHSGPRHVAIFEQLDEEEDEFDILVRDAYERVTSLLKELQIS